MAALPAAEVDALYAEFMRRSSQARIPIPLTKSELLAVFTAANTWKGANDTSYNGALPMPGRTSLSAKDKALVLTMILERSYNLTP